MNTTAASIRQWAIGLVVAMTITIAPSASAAPCAGFADVDDGSTFCPNVEWLKNRAITLGCTSGTYCRTTRSAALRWRLS